MRDRQCIGIVLTGVLVAVIVAGAMWFLQPASDTPAPVADDDVVLLKQTSFADLPAWQADRLAEVLPAMARSCAVILRRDATRNFGPLPLAGTAADWQEPCRHLPSKADVAAVDLHAFFEKYFTPYAVYGASDRGLFTGYYEPQLTTSPDAAVPLYAPPRDMVTVDLGAFRPALKGETIQGRVTAAATGALRLAPYYTRAEIDAGAIGDVADVVAYVDDPVDAFFLHIQGSGQIRDAAGNIRRVGYAAQNGHPYTAIGRALIAKGIVAREDMSMQKIRAYLEQNPDAARELMNMNASYVFFQPLDTDGVLGAEGTVLTPHRSLAVDRRKFPYGAPVFVDIEHPAGEKAIRRLMVAQDTGGAIRGAVRGDYFWGAGDAATQMAGMMKSRGRMWILLPRTVNVPATFLYTETE